ncbi:MAG: N-acetyltransferase family protein [Clostridia bacterium]|nr:N-acetyltransferase family protein [Clostridia bacterium]
MSLILTDASPSDAEELLAIYAPYVENTAISYEYVPPTAEEFRRRIEKVLTAYPYLTVREDGHILGYAYASRFKERKAYDRSVELSVYVRADCRGRGIGRMLYTEMEKRLPACGVTNLYACIAVPSLEKGPDEYASYDSVKFHTAMGYAMVGRFAGCACKFGRVYDMVFMEKRI